MRSLKPKALGMIMMGSLAGAGVVLLAQSTMKPGHDRVPPYREPSPYMSAAEIQTAIGQLDPKVVAGRTGGAVSFAKDKAEGVVRRRMTGPQYAITHTRTLEYIIVAKGTATMVTGSGASSCDSQRSAAANGTKSMYSGRASPARPKPTPAATATTRPRVSYQRA